MGNLYPVEGWQLTWHQLKDMKEFYPVQIAKYAVQNRISEQPAFAWWVRHVLKKRDRIISKTASNYWQRTHKYSIRILKSIK